MTLPQLWAILGILFLIAELVSVSFVFAFLGVGALVTALFSWVGLTEGVAGQLLTFSVVTVATLAFGRKPLKSWFRNRGRGRDYVEYVGDRATVTKTIPAQGEGRIAYRGTEWIAVSENQVSIGAGQMVVIRQMDGIRAVVTAVTENQVTL
ncbi:NfeD family protein [Larkinella soli]|uniref:NfeD family protein n=1 Tax=Larkinella soli TaxID=1770527 RepID=UPI000FFB6E04|nr:NfeD family protein [Larkinella soli]